MDTAIQMMEHALALQASGDYRSHSRVHLDYPIHSSAWAHLGEPGLCMGIQPAIVPKLGGAGLRIYTGAGEGDPPCEVLLLFTPNMALRSMIEDYSLHAIRTAAPSAIAARYLARPDSHRVGIIGSGRQARGQLSALASVMDIHEVHAYSRNAHRLSQFCHEMQAMLEVPVIPCNSAEHAVRCADVVITATNATGPVISSDWLLPGAHINSIAPAELERDLITMAHVFPCDLYEVAHGIPRWDPFPDLLEAGILTEHDLKDELCQVVAGNVPGRVDDSEITIFVSTGMAIWDLAIALWADERARASGKGKLLWDGSAGRSLVGLVTPRPG
jgi:alanine dehydrogenase